MKKQLLFFLLCFVALSASAQREWNLVFIGNSITYGALHKNPELTAPPVKCAQWLASQPGFGATHCLNMGKSGRTTFHFVPAKTGMKNYWGELKSKTAKLVASHPQAGLVFSIMLGTNDAAERPSNSRTTAYMYRHNIGLIIDSLRAIYPQAIFVLHRPIYFSAPFTTKNGSLQDKQSLRMLTLYYKESCRMAKAYQTSGLARVYAGDKDAYGYFKKNYLTALNHEHGYQNCDFWLHPTEAGSAVLAEYWGRAILKAVESAGE